MDYRTALRIAAVTAAAVLPLSVAMAGAAAAIEINEYPGRVTTGGNHWLVPVLAGGAVIAALIVIMLMFSRMGSRKQPARREDVSRH